MADFLAGAATGATVTVLINAVDKASGVFANVNKNMLAVGAGITAVGVGGAVAITTLANAAGKASSIADAFNNMFGKDSASALATLKKATNGAVSDIDLMTQANQAMLLGIDPDMLPAMFEGARVAAQATGKPISEAIADITLGIGRQSRMILDNLGIIVKVDEANQAYADSLGITTGELTDADKKTAFLNATMEALQDNAAKIGDLETTVAEKTQQMGASWDNAKISLGNNLIPVLEFFINNIVTPVINFFEAHPTIAKWAAIILVAGTALALIVGPAMMLVALIPAFVTGLGSIAAGMTAVSIAGLPVWVVALLIAAAIAALIGIGYLLVKHWDKIKVAAGKLGVFLKNVFIGIHNVVMSVWTGIVSFIEKSINKVIDMVNSLISKLNKIPGINIGKIGNISFDKFKGEQMAYEVYQPTASLSTSGQGDTYNFNGDVNGMTGEDIAGSLQDILSKKVSSG